MAKRKVKKTSRKTLGIALYIIAMITVVTVVAIYQRNLQSYNPPTRPASDYFSFSGGFATATPLDPNNNTIKISTVSFEMTVVGVNVTNVHIYVLEGLVPEEEMPYFPGPIIQDQTISVGPIMYSYEVIKEKEEGKGWGPLNFRLTCNEAEGKFKIEGNFSIYITEFLPSPSS